MTVAQDVKITKVLVAPDFNVKTGDNKIDANINGLLTRISMRLQPYLVEWTGSRIPRGAVVNGHTIAWTQHGIVRVDGGKEVGYYNRVIDDLDAPRQSMIIFSGEIEYDTATSADTGAVGGAMTGSYNATATKEERIRKSIEFQIMTMLNHAQRHGANVIFDCGEWGMCHVYWHKGSWCTNWIATEKFEPLVVEAKEGR